MNEQKCESCAKLIKDNEKIIDSQGDVYCEKCVHEMIKLGIYCSIEDFQGFDD